MVIDDDDGVWMSAAEMDRVKGDLPPPHEVKCEMMEARGIGRSNTSILGTSTTVFPDSLLH